MHRGWHFLQIPGPSNTPQRVLKAIQSPTIDHRGPEFGEITRGILPKVRTVFGTSGEVIIYPSSGTGAWEAALVNLFAPGDQLLSCETGHFSTLWKNLAENIGLKVTVLPGDWRGGANADQIQQQLRADREHRIKGVMVVHNETSTGVTSDIQSVRQALDEAEHPALLLVDVVSSLATTPFNQDAWGVDVAISASQKGFMMPPGLGFNAVNQKAIEAAKEIQTLQSYWKWDRIIDMNRSGFYPYTPASNLLVGLNEALDMLLEEGLEAVFERHHRHAVATRHAAATWGLENQCINESEYSDSTTALVTEQADDLRKVAYEQLNMSLGTGLGKLKGKIFRIGHLGDFNDLMLCGTLAGVEMAMQTVGIPHGEGGVQAAMAYLTSTMNQK